MSKISLSFQFDSLVAATEFLAGLNRPEGAHNPVVSAPAPDTPAEAETKRRKRRTNAEIAADEAAAAAAANPPVAAPASAGPAPETAPDADAPTAPSSPSAPAADVTFQQVVDALTALMNKHGLPVVVMTLQRFGASKSSDLKPAQYAEIHAYALHQASLATPTVADAAPAPGLPF